MLDAGFQSIMINDHSYECSLTTDIAVFGYQRNELMILLLKRDLPFEQNWILPGGALQENQTIEDSADNVLYLLTNIKDIVKEQVKCYSNFGRHPIKRVITISFYALIKPENHPISVMDNVTEIKWFPVNKIPSTLGFDHNQIFKDAYSRLKENLKNNLILGELLPKKFTIQEIQLLYESILGEKLDRRNFRKKILNLDILQNTNEKKTGVQGGPALYKLKWIK